MNIRQKLSWVSIGVLIGFFIVFIVLIVRSSYPDMNRAYAIHASTIGFFDRKTWDDKDANYSEEYLANNILNLEPIKKYQAEITIGALYHNMTLENGTFITYSDDGHILIVRYPAIEINSDNKEKRIVWKCFSIPEGYLSGKCKDNRMVPINKAMQ